jgi:hypothetical protein
MTISTIRDGIMTRLETISGLRAHDTVPEQINPPAAVVSIGGVIYDSDFDGSTTYEFRIRLLVGGQSFRLGEDLLDGYLDPTGAKSIRAAIDADPTLSGTADSSRVTGVTQPRGLVEYGGNQYLSAELDVEVFA